MFQQKDLLRENQRFLKEIKKNVKNKKMFKEVITIEARCKKEG